MRWSIAIAAIVLIVTLANEAGAANGRCVVATDCDVLGARCVDTSCTIVSPLELFPTQPDLAEIELAEPAQLAQVSVTPEFHWIAPVGADLVAVAVFPVLPRYDDQRDRISNFYQAKWVWHSKLPGGSVSSTSVPFEEGRGLVESSLPNHDILTDRAPPPLPPGVYYWGAWAWTGFALTHRSVVRTFVVGVEGITGTPCHCDGVAAFRCVVQYDYCVVACASNVDCFQGSTCDLTSLTTGHPWGVCRTQAKGCMCDPMRCDEDLGLCYQSHGEMPPGDGCGSGGSGGGACRTADPRVTLMLVLVVAWLLYRRRLR